MAETVRVYLHRKRGFRRADQKEHTFYGPGQVDLPVDVAREMGFSVASQPRVVLDGPTAKALADAGLDTPARIRAATDEQLTAVPGVGQKKLEQIRQKFGREG